MIKKEVLDKTSAWPFVEAKKMLRERKSFIEKKGKITLQTGYGPSGLPHIGTFGEVARTSMMVNALKQLTDLPTEIITFSDDMDGLRKVPENIPNDQVLKDNLGKPLTNIPDPFNKFNSFGEHNNEMLKDFLNSWINDWRAQQKLERKDCSYGLTISSFGPAGRIQGSVLGDYRRRDEHIMEWPTWDMRCRDNRYLYRCPCGKTNDWLFGKLKPRKIENCF